MFPGEDQRSGWSSDEPRDATEAGVHLGGDDPRPSGAVGPSPGDRQAVYGISVAAELTGVKPAMLRVYEEHGLVRPHRTAGGTRRYSAVDLAWISRISALLEQGLNFAGVAAVLGLERTTRELRQEVDDLRGRLEAEAD